MDDDKDRPLRVGFIGALNTVNVANMEEFLREFEHRSDVAAAPLIFHVAGEVCEFLESRHPQVRLLGRIAALEDFYDGVDVVAVPMAHSTGLKIKTGEALAFGKAVVATDDGFDGFPPIDAFHNLDSFAEVCSALVILAHDRARLAELERLSRITARLARRRMELGYRRLAAAVLRVPPVIFFVTDLPVFDEGNPRVERLAQWCQLCSRQTKTIVGYLGEGAPDARRPDLAEIEMLALNDANGTPVTTLANWDRLGGQYNICEVILSVDGESARVLRQAAAERCSRIILDTWRAALAEIAACETTLPVPDYWPAFERDTDALLSMMALRYRPRFLDSWRANRAEGVLAVLCGPDDGDRVGLEILTRHSASLKSSSVLTLATIPRAPFEQDFFIRLREATRPRLIIAIGSDASARALCEALGTIFRIPCIHLASAHFPCLTTREDGTPTLCESYADFARSAAADPEVLRRFTPAHREDTGWSGYKADLARRLAEDRKYPPS
jgi:hypothetical protein